MAVMSERFLRVTRWYVRGGDVIVFLAIWLLIALTIGQDQLIERFSPTYWTAVGSALLFPILRFRQTFENLLLGKARPLTAFAILATAWWLFNRDLNMIPPVILLTVVGGWATRREISIDRRHIFALFLFFMAIGSTKYLLQPSSSQFAWLNEHSGGDPLAASSLPAGTEQIAKLPDQNREGLEMNLWGILPGQTASVFGPWRVSLTPNVATSGIFSFFVLLIALYRPRLRLLDITVISVCAYFAVLSFIRSVHIGFILFTGTLVAIHLCRTMPRLKVSLAFILPAVAVLALFLLPPLLYLFQDTPIISRLVLRGQTGMSVDDIYRQIYRPWLWREHISLFLSSDNLMGLGSELAINAKETFLNANQARSDSDSFITRLLATYGIASLGLVYFVVERCYHHARRGDNWATACAAVFIWLMMTWGSSFHPTNGVFVISFMILGLGSGAFLDGRDLDSTSVNRTL